MIQPLKDCIAEIKGALVEYLSPRELPGVIDWVQNNIDLGRDMTSAKGGKVQLDSYQVEPLEALDTKKVRRVSLMAVEQIGKSSIWQWYLLFRQDVDPAPAIVVYPSDEIAADTNRERLEPLMQGIPKLAGFLKMPKVKRRDAYHFPDSVTHFQGAGAPILSRPFAITVADEPDFWLGLTNDSKQEKQSQKAQKNVSNLKNLHKRTRTYRKTRKMLEVCSPTLKSGQINQSFLKGSQGWWHLSCVKCAGLIRSADTHRLQWETAEDGEPIESSLRLTCPHCGREHTEDDAPAMNEASEGARYVHAENSREDHRSFQVGALACPRAISWLEIAEAQMLGGDSGTLEDQKYFDNSFRGIPLQPRKRRENEEAMQALRAHCRPTPPKLCAALLSSDTQDNGWFVIVRGIDHEGNAPLLAANFVETLAEVGAMYNTRYEGILPMAGIIDEGGHRGAEVTSYVRSVPGLYTYKGESAVKDLRGWTPSKNKARLILANPYQFQELRLWLIHSHTDDSAGGFWSLPDNVDEFHPDYLSQIGSYGPNNRKRHGNEYRNWTPTGPDHFFDAEKQWLVLLDYVLKKVNPKFFIGGALPRYYIERLKIILKRQGGSRRGQRKAAVPAGG